MNTKAAVYAALALLVAIGVVWLALSGSQKSEENVATTTPEASTASAGNHSIQWNFSSTDADEAMPHTKVAAVIDGTSYEVGTYTGTCREVDGSGGAGGTGLIDGELSGVQCWFAGGGDELGVFKENGQFVVKHGDLDEGGYNIPGVRGNFKTVLTAGAAL